MWCLRVVACSAVCGLVAAIPARAQKFDSPEQERAVKALQQFESKRKVDVSFRTERWEQAGNDPDPKVAATQEIRGLTIARVGNPDDDLVPSEVWALLKHFPKTKRLVLGPCSAKDQDLEVLKELPELELLSLLEVKVKGDVLKALKGHKNLKTVTIRSTATDEIVKYFKDLPALKELDLERSPITDATIKVLGSMKNLEKLNLGITKVSPAGVRSLKTALPKTAVLGEDRN